MVVLLKIGTCAIILQRQWRIQDFHEGAPTPTVGVITYY